MPLYDYKCGSCGLVKEVLALGEASPPQCCGEVMTRCFNGGSLIKTGPPIWLNRMNDIHKAQAERGERLRFVHPSEIGAN